MNDFSPIFDGLNPEQKEAVSHLYGPLLVLAGAGSGKTKTLTHRLANILARGECPPECILAVTFTNKAAREMRLRTVGILNLLGFQFRAEELWITTFHSFGARLLRDFGQLVGYPRDFIVLDESDQVSLVKEVMNRFSLDEEEWDPRKIVSLFNRVKGESLDPLVKLSDILRFKYDRQKIIDLFQLYQRKLLDLGSVDFGDLILKPIELLRGPCAENIRTKFLFVLVDEYQDTNPLQYLLLKELVSQHRNICAVGDEDQSIYGWRGADISNILNFEKDFEGTRVIRLERNYRSTQVILDAANAVIRNNQLRKGKTLYTENKGGSKIQMYPALNEADEARYVARYIQQLSHHGVTLSEISILYRTHAQSRALEEQLRLRQIPYRIVGGLKFFDRAEIKDVIGYLRLINNPKDDIAFRRVLNVPARGLGKSTLSKIQDVSNQSGFSLWEATLFLVQGQDLSPSTRNKLSSFLELLDELSHIKSQMNLLEFYTELLHRTGYQMSLLQEKTEEAQSRLQNLEQFASVIEQFEKERAQPNWSEFLQEMALVSDQDDLDDSPSVSLMTIHTAKGLEFHTVFVVGLEEEIFPSNRSLDEDRIEEERRLFYVAMTRARENLILSYAMERRVWGRPTSGAPSRFLKELPPECVEQKGFNFRSHYQSSYQEEQDTSYDDTPSHPLSIWRSGVWVRHPHFGKGQVLSVEGSGPDARLLIKFQSQEVKKLIARYAKLEPLR